MRKQIYEAYDAIQPNDQTYAEILKRVQSGRRTRQRKRRAIVRRRLVRIALCAALIALLSGLGVATYRRWSLPAPQVYTPNASTGVYTVHEQTEEPKQQSDDAWIEKGIQVLHLVQLTDLEQPKGKVTRRTNQSWQREEIFVEFPELDDISVTFDAQKGYLLQISSIDWVQEGTACADDAQALALAETFYAALPVPQGYAFTNCTKYDEQYWSFEFCKAVTPELYNEYEMVRLAVNPVSGRLTGLNVFYVPLLDDHEPGDVPLSQEEAEAVARACSEIYLDGFTLSTAKVCIALPNWMFTEQMSIGSSVSYSAITRLAWELTYIKHDDLFDDQIRIDVDYYTGEILGGDMT